MPFQRYVQSGRVAYVSDGLHKGKLVTIVDVIDQNRVLTDGPAHNIPRGEMKLNDLHLTKFRISIPFTGSTRVVRKAWEDAKIDEKWSQTMWARKVQAKAKRETLSDFDRFKLRKARQIRNKIRTEAFFNLKNSIKKKRKEKLKGKSGEKKEKKKVEKKAKK